MTGQVYYDEDRGIWCCELNDGRILCSSTLRGMEELLEREDVKDQTAGGEG